MFITFEFLVKLDHKLQDSWEKTFSNLRSYYWADENRSTIKNIWVTSSALIYTRMHDDNNNNNIFCVYIRRRDREIIFDRFSAQKTNKFYKKFYFKFLFSRGIINSTNIDWNLRYAITITEKHLYYAMLIELIALVNF